LSTASQETQHDIIKKRTNRIKRYFSDASVIQLYSLCILPILLVFIFNYLPMFGIVIAFKKYNYDKGILGSDWVGFDNFTYLFKTKSFFNVAWNTIFLNSIFIFAGIVCAVVLAILLFEIKRKLGVKIYQTVLITPHFLSWVVVGYMAYAFLNPDRGFLNSIVNLFGFEGVQWYMKPKIWPVILAIASIWKIVGMDSVIYYAALMGIDTNLFEAAQIDGAGKLRVIKDITLPCLAPLITIIAILKIGEIFRADFGLFYQLTRDVGTLYSTTDVMDTYIFRTMRVLGDLSTSSAAGLLQSVVGFVLVVIANFCTKLVDPDRALF